MTTLRVVEALLGSPQEEHYGYSLAKETGLGRASVHGILMRLEDEGWLIARLEDIDPHREGRQPRRLYAITDCGHSQMPVLLRQHRNRVAPLKESATATA